MDFPQKSILSQNGGNPEVSLRIPTEDERDKFNNPPPYDEFLGSIGGMFYPNSFSREAAQELGLADESGYYDSFFYTQDLYRYIAESLLFDKLNLAHYDSVVAETGLAPRDQEHRIYYQRMSTMPTEYIYLRNNIYIERLSKSEIQLFLDAIDGDKAVINDELIAIVEKTMSLVLKKSVDLENVSVH